MPVEQLTFDWIETSDGVIVRLPAPRPVVRSVGCAATMLIFAAMLGLLVVFMVVWRLIEGPRAGFAVWVVQGVVAVAVGCLLRYVVRVFREARMPPGRVEPSVLSVVGGLFKVERAGRDRGVDYSWEIPEIADVRLCAAAPDRVFLSVRSLLSEALFPREVVRISVERRTGDVDDVLVLAPGRYWADALEGRLREYLNVRAGGGITSR